MAEQYWAEISPEEALVAIQVREIKEKRKKERERGRERREERTWEAERENGTKSDLTPFLLQEDMELEELDCFNAYIQKHLRRPVEERDEIYRHLFSAVRERDLRVEKRGERRERREEKRELKEENREKRREEKTREERTEEE
jgi:hypothetical protein